MSEFTRLAGIEPLYKYDLDPKVDKAKEREAARIEMARIRKEREHQSVIDDRTRVMSGLKDPAQAGMNDVGENLDMGRPEDPKDYPTESRSKSLAAKRAFVKKVQAKYGRKMPGFDPEDFPKIRGMEGPFYMKTKGGRQVLYYDPKEGEYYDRKSDMYFPADQLESKEATGTLGEAASKRYEIVVNGRLKKAIAKPKTAVVLARRQKGSVQVVDSETGDILYDSEVRDPKVSRTMKKAARNAAAAARKDRRASDAKLMLGKLP